MLFAQGLVFRIGTVTIEMILAVERASIVGWRNRRAKGREEGMEGVAAGALVWRGRKLVLGRSLCRWRICDVCAKVDWWVAFLEGYKRLIWKVS